jgi:hypothetical protein
MSADPVEMSGVERAREVLRKQLPDLNVAAIPTKSEVFVVCGRPARDLHDAITMLLAHTDATPAPAQTDAVEVGSQGINALHPHPGRHCHRCPALDVAHIIDGDPLCMTCCHKWVRGEGSVNDDL